MLPTPNKPSALSREFRIIPWWAYLFAAISIAVAAPLFYFHWNPPGHHLAPFRVLFTFMISCIAASLVMLIGYVNRDAKRRNMNSVLWTVLVIFIPNAVGFILYFLLRQPLLVPCPQCGTMANPHFNFCPKCKFNLRPTCPSCQHAVSVDDQFCPHCARELKAATT